MPTRNVRTLLTLSLPLLLAGCRLEVLVNEGGRVTSASGQRDCDELFICSGEVSDPNFEETFTAIPNPGYRFVGWSETESTVCEGSDQPCELSLRDLPPTIRRSLLGSDSVARLVAVFEQSGSLSRYRVSGDIGILAEAVLDSDTNNPDNGYAPNDTVATAQVLNNPGTAGGYINEAGSGDEGNTQAEGDLDDFFRIDAEAGDVITLFASDYIDSDLDLYLYNEAGEIIDASLGTGEIEQLIVPSSGTWYANPYVYAGAANYVLTIGQGGGSVSAGHELVPGEVLVTLGGEGVLRADIAEGQRRQITHKFSLSEQGGGLARARRLVAGSSTGNALGINNNPRLLAQHAAMAHDPELLARWETLLLAKQLAREPGVALAEPNWRVRAAATTNDTFIDFLWHYELINLPAAWDTTTGDPGITIAVIDTGIIAEHPDMQGQLVDGYDFIADVSSAGDGDGIDPDPTDEGEGSNAFRSGNFHGLHVAGTIGAGGNNGTGIAGVAYSSRIMPLRALDADGAGSVYDILQAVRYAAGLSNDSGTFPADRADVINLSLGGGGYLQTAQNLYETVTDLGILVAGASGNDGASSVDYPGAYDGVFAVGATDAGNGIADYSNQGRDLDLTAPGGRLEADANGDGQPDGVLSTYYADGAPEYYFLQGTSMATPHVAGVFALMKSVNPDLDTETVDALLQQGRLTDDLGDNGRDDTYGWGLINARKAVNSALEAAGGVVDVPPSLGASTSVLNFGTTQGSADIVLSNRGSGSLSVSGADASASWLSAAPRNTDAEGLGVWQVSVDRAGLGDGQYSASVTFNSSAGNVTVAIEMRIASGGAGDVGVIYILFIDTETQETLEQAVTFADNEYAFSLPQLTEGRYEVWAGTDNDNDFFICDDGETCGAWQTLDSPRILEITGDRSDLNFSSDFQISLPDIGASSLQTVRGNDLAKPRRPR
ncbi:MAG: S8 family serine peptidase [Cellvibrionales bacterium]|jgi:serine protease